MVHSAARKGGRLMNDQTLNHGDTPPEAVQRGIRRISQGRLPLPFEVFHNLCYMKRPNILFALSVFISVALNAQNGVTVTRAAAPVSLPRSSPEAEGVPSA